MGLKVHLFALTLTIGIQRRQETIDTIEHRNRLKEVNDSLLDRHAEFKMYL